MSNQVKYHIEMLADLIDENTDQEEIESFYVLVDFVDLIGSNKRQSEIKKRQLEAKNRMSEEKERELKLQREINQCSHYRGSASRKSYAFFA